MVVKGFKKRPKSGFFLRNLKIIVILAADLTLLQSMKNITKLTLTAVAVVSFSLSAFSQKALKKADEAFESHQYFNAVNLYKQAYASAPKDKRGMILFRSGVSSQKINDYKAAESYYQKSIAANYDNPEV